jgi:hypothetical protein
MKIPGGEDTIDAVACRVFEDMERAEALANPAHRLTAWSELRESQRQQFRNCVRGGAEHVVVAVIFDMRCALRDADKYLGPAFEVAVIEYAKTDLDYGFGAEQPMEEAPFLLEEELILK